MGMPEENGQYSWYAVHTRPRWEKKVAEYLATKGVEHYCPLNKVLRQWSDRKKVVLDPVFKGYVFVRPENDKKWELTKIPGILSYVYRLGKPAEIRESEILLIKKFLNEFSDVAVGVPAVTPNSSVRITQGIMMNYQGMVVEVFGNRAIVRIDTLDIQLSAQFDKKHLEIIRG